MRTRATQAAWVLPLRRLRRAVLVSVLTLAMVLLAATPGESTAVQVPIQNCIDQGGATHECRRPDFGPWTYRGTAYCGGSAFATEAQAVACEEAAHRAVHEGPWPKRFCSVRYDPTGQDWIPWNSSYNWPTEQAKDVKLIYGYFSQYPSGCASVESGPDGGISVIRSRTWVCPSGFDQDWALTEGNYYLCARKLKDCTDEGCPGKVGKPIDVVDQAEQNRENDFSTANPRLRIERTYDSTWSASGDLPALRSFGTRWTTNFDRTLLIRTAQSVPVVIRYSASQAPVPFKKQGGTWVSTIAGTGALIEQTEAGVTTGWRFISIDNEVEDFDTNGRVISLAGMDGKSVSFTYGGDGLLSSVQDQFLRTITFAAATSDAGGPGRVITDPAGNQYHYHFGPTDASGSTQLDSGTYPLMKVVFPGGAVREYEYRTAGTGGLQSQHRSLLLTIRNDSATYATLAYDNYGRATSTALGTGVSSYSVAPGSNSDTKLVTDPRGSVREYLFGNAGSFRKLTRITHPAGSGTPSATEEFTYGSDGQLVSRKDPKGTKTCFRRDAARRIETGRVEGMSAGASCPSDIGTYTPASGTTERKVLVQLHPDWRLESRRAEPKEVTTLVYNGQPDPTAGGTVVTCAPGTALVDGKPIAVLCKRVKQATSDETGASGFSATAVGTARAESWTYNEYGQVLTHDGPRTDLSDITTYEYYADTQADWTKGDLKKVTNPLGQVTEFTKYDRNGRILRSVDANGMVTEHTYHVRGWLIQTKVTPSGGGTPQTTDYEYDGVGQLKKATQPDGSFVRFTYDDALRLTQVEDNAGNKVVYTLDATGARVKEETKDPNGALARKASRTMDALNRVQTVTGAAQ